MSSNHKYSGSNGHAFSSHKQKKGKELSHARTNGWNWKMMLVLLWLVVVFFAFLWVLVNFKHGKFCWGVLSSTNEEKIQVITDNCHITEEKFASSECCRVSGYRAPRGCAATCDLQIPSSEDQKFHKHSDLGTENIQFNRQCSYTEERKANSLGLLFRQDMAMAFIPCSAFSSISSMDFCYREVAKVCLWILLGVAMSYNLLRVRDKFWGHNHQTSQQQPPSQQPQLQQQAQVPPQNTGKWMRMLLMAFVIAGVIFCMWLFWYLYQDGMSRRKETLASMCDERARMLQDQFNVSMNHVHALAILISTFHHGKQPSAIDQKTFEDYTERTAFERPLTSGVAYALRVRHSEREQIEQKFGWTIKKMGAEDQTLAQDYNPENFCISPVQDEYAPVIFSQKTVSHIVSIDMMSGKEDRENILRARASGKGVLTSPFKLLKSNHLGVVLTFAVYNIDLPPHATPEQRVNATVGYLGASYDVPSLVEKLLHQLASKQTVIVNVYDTTSKDAPIKMYGPDVEDTGLLHISHLDFGDPTRKHEMQCRFKQKPPQPWQAIAASSGALIIILLLGHIFDAAINQIAKVERDCREEMVLKDRAEAADVAKSQFLATVSHEIRTPMNGVLGMLQMLMDTNLDDTQKDYAETAHSSGRDLISLINKVLDQAKIESDRLELEAVPFDLRGVLDKVVSIFSCENGIELAVYISDQVPQVVVGDQERFGQIIKNLVGNSIKFTHVKGHIFITVHLADELRLPLDIKDEVLRQSLHVVQDGLNVSCYNTLSGFQVVDRWRSWERFKNLGDTSDEPGKIRLLVTVEDTGAGIPPEAQGRIFTPFMQADSSTSRKYGGTGIGLSISKRLVTLMGGEIGFVSELNVGSTFSFTVTFNRAETNSLDAMRQQYDTDVSVFKGVRALIIDEKRIRAAVTSYHLQRLGISVEITSGMESACSYLSCIPRTSMSGSEYFAMVLIDQENWDKETCPTFLTLIRTLKHYGSRGKLRIPLKVFLLSTCISYADRNKLKLEGLVDEVITKPLRISSLISVFQEATGKRNETKVKQPSNLRSLLNGKQILVVDDNAVNRRVAEGALKKYGAIVICVDGGKQAVELLKPPHRFDACFMDLQMPEIDGFEATRQIRCLESKYNEESTSGEMSVDGKSQWHTPILAMTADVVQGTNEKCVKCGMDDYVSKPFGEGQLYSAVARFFEAG